MKRRFSLLLAVLLILYLFIGCTVEHDISAPSSTPPAKVQTENVQTPEPSQKAEIPPSPVEAKLEMEDRTGRAGNHLYFEQKYEKISQVLLPLRQTDFPQKLRRIL